MRVTPAVRAALLCAALLAALTACQQPGSDTRKPLLGSDLPTLLDRLGPPVKCRGAHGVLTLAYMDAQGGLVEDAVIVIGGTVAKVADGLAPSAPTTAGEGLVLAPIDEIVAQRGPAEIVSQGATSTIVAFGDWRAQVVDGLVHGLAKR